MVKTHNKISVDNAEKSFLEIKDCFGFNVSEAKAREMTLIVKGTEVRTTEKYDPTEDIIRLLQEGRIEFDVEKEVIKFNLLRPIKDKSGQTFGVIEMGILTFNMQRQLKVPLSEMDPSSLSDEKLLELLCIMTGISDQDVFGDMPVSELNCFRSIANIFFN